MLSMDNNDVNDVEPINFSADEHGMDKLISIMVVANADLPNTSTIVSIDEDKMMRSVFDPTEKDVIEGLVGCFTRSNYCNVDDGTSNPFPLVSSSPRIVFTAQNCAHEHMWIDPPHTQIDKYLSHYVKCKKEHPTTTSAVIMVPKWVGGSHGRKHLNGMRLLKE